MKVKPLSGNYPDYSENDNTPIYPSTSSEIIHEINSPEYNIPEKETKTWCSYMEREFRASRVMTEKQFRNHNNAPANITVRETSTDKLQPDEFIE